MNARRAIRLSLLFWVGLLIPHPGAFSLHLPGSEEEEFRWHREQLEEDLRKPEAFLHLLDVFASRPYVPRPEEVRQCLERVAAHSQAPELLKAHALWFLSILDTEAGRLAEAVAKRQALGFICDWLLLGPFDNPNKGGFATPYAPEGKVAFDQAYAGKDQEVRWRATPSLFPFGEVYLHDLFRPAENAVGYALTYIHVTEPTEVAIRVGSDDAVKVFMDGQVVLAHNAYHQAEFDQVAAGVRLTAGWHRLLVKVCQSHGDWMLMLRLTTPSGSPLPVAPWSGPADTRAIRVLAEAAEIQKLGIANVTSPVTAIPNVEDPLREFQRRVEASPRDSESRARLAYYYAWKRNFDRTERRDLVELEATAAVAPWYPYYHLLLGYWQEDFNARRRAIEKAVALAPNFGRALYGLATYYAARGMPDKALEFAERAAQAEPAYLAPRLLLAQLHATHFLRAKALETAREFATRCPASALLQREAARYCEMLNLAPDAELFLHKAVSLDFCNRETRKKLIEIAKDRGDLTSALAHYDALLTRWPSDGALQLEKADLLVTDTQYEQAAALCSAALDLCPRNPLAWEKLGHCQHRLGQFAQALKSWDQSLALMPQNAALKEYVEFLTPQEDTFEREFVLNKDDLLNLSSEAGTPANETALCLLDVTVWKVHPNGLHSTFYQKAYKLLSDKSADQFRSFALRYAPLLQDLVIKQARVLKPSGEVLTAPPAGAQSITRGTFGIYYDLRARVLSFPALEPGDIVELQYRIHDIRTSNPFGDSFRALTYLRGKYPVKRRDCVLIMPKGREVFHRLSGANVPPVVRSGQETVHLWRFTDLPRVETERHTPGQAETLGYLHLSTMETWDALGRQYAGLIREQFRLENDAKSLAQELTKGKASELDKIRALFNHLAKNWRYVGLEFGIHGHKPYPAQQVFTRKFGDCKDKAVLLSAMLRDIGIESQVALVRTRSLGAIEPYPASLAAFNHALCYVPSASLWLDCTVEHAGSRELPPSDQGAMALLINPKGESKLVQIPVLPAQTNLSRHEFIVTTQLDGSISVEGHNRASGLHCKMLRQVYSVRDKQRQTFERNWTRALPGIKVRKVEFSDLTDLEADVRCVFAFDAPNYCLRSDGELAFTTNLLGFRLAASYADQATRTHDVELPYPWRMESSFVFRFPKGFVCAQPPEAVQQSTPFGQFQRTVQIHGSALHVTETFQLDVIRVTRSDYPAFREFCLFADQRLNEKIRIRK